MVAREIDEMRQRAEWMVPSDDPILELIREHGNLSPKAVEKLGGPSSKHAGVRCRTLARYGLLFRITEGLYGITDEGRAYLDEEFDPSQLECVPLEQNTLVDGGNGAE